MTYIFLGKKISFMVQLICKSFFLFSSKSSGHQYLAAGGRKDLCLLSGLNNPEKRMSQDDKTQFSSRFFITEDADLYHTVRRKRNVFLRIIPPLKRKFAKYNDPATAR